MGTGNRVRSAGAISAALFGHAGRPGPKGGDSPEAPPSSENRRKHAFGAADGRDGPNDLEGACRDLSRTYIGRHGARIDPGGTAPDPMVRTGTGKAQEARNDASDLCCSPETDFGIRAMPTIGVLPCARWAGTVGVDAAEVGPLGRRRAVSRVEGLLERQVPCFGASCCVPRGLSATAVWDGVIGTFSATKNEHAQARSRPVVARMPCPRYASKPIARPRNDSGVVYSPP